MPLPIQPASRSAASLVPEGHSRREGRELLHGLNREISRGIIATTRVQSAAVVAATGLQMTAMLSREATFQAGGDPATEARLNYIVDRYAEYVGSEIAGFGLR